jgi:hypothetical protein
MMTNFSRHIAKHEKNGDKIKQELMHLCALPSVQQQLQQQQQLQLQQQQLQKQQQQAVYQSMLSSSPELQYHYQRLQQLPPHVQYQQHLYLQQLQKLKGNIPTSPPPYISFPPPPPSLYSLLSCFCPSHLFSSFAANQLFGFSFISRTYPSYPTRTSNPTQPDTK